MGASRSDDWATSAPSVVGHANDRGEWENMNSAAMIEPARWANGEPSVHRRYFISSLPARADLILALRESVGELNPVKAGEVAEIK